MTSMMISARLNCLQPIYFNHFIYKYFFCLYLFIPFIFLPITAYAWNATGHRLVAAIAYQELEPQVRARADKLIANLHEEYPAINSFEQAAGWMDTLRSQKIETYTHWHYIDMALNNDDHVFKQTLDTDNAVWALKNIQVVVANSKANKYERARFLAYLIHIVADLHQPLHTVSYFSTQYPKGDKGGNLYFIRYKHQRMRLHRLWDGGVGLFEKEGQSFNINLLIRSIISFRPKEFFTHEIKNMDAMIWVQEGNAHAKQSVYTVKEEEELTPMYVATARNVVEEQIALAGYRLAYLLNLLLAK